jgi:hypothetical protein
VHVSDLHEWGVLVVAALTGDSNVIVDGRTSPRIILEVWLKASSPFACPSDNRTIRANTRQYKSSDPLHWEHCRYANLQLAKPMYQIIDPFSIDPVTPLYQSV